MSFPVIIQVGFHETWERATAVQKIAKELAENDIHPELRRILEIHADFLFYLLGQSNGAMIGGVVQAAKLALADKK